MKMRIRPIGFSVLVRPDEVEEVSKGGIILNPNDREQAVITEGVILAVAEGAWSDKPGGSYPKEGNRVIFAKYAGSDVLINESTGEKAKLLVDEDIKAIIED
jgi:chaperonin GroES